MNDFKKAVQELNSSYFIEADKIWIKSVIQQVKEQTRKDITPKQAKELLGRNELKDE